MTWKQGLILSAIVVVAATLTCLNFDGSTNPGSGDNPFQNDTTGRSAVVEGIWQQYFVEMQRMNLSPLRVTDTTVAAPETCWNPGTERNAFALIRVTADSLEWDVWQPGDSVYVRLRYARVTSGNSFTVMSDSLFPSVYGMLTAMGVSRSVNYFFEDGRLVIMNQANYQFGPNGNIMEIVQTSCRRYTGAFPPAGWPSASIVIF